MDVMLASPATGPVDKVWFSAEGLLFARTHSGKIFQTLDFETWLPAGPAAEAASSAVPEPPVIQPVRFPEPGARVIAGPRSRVYSLGRQLMRSDDEGRTWANLTGYKSQSVIGGVQRSVAVSPARSVTPCRCSVAKPGFETVTV